MLDKLLKIEKMFWQTTDGVPQFILKLIRVIALVIRGLISERPTLKASALTYTTTLTIIPTLAMFLGILNFINPAEKYENEIESKLLTFMTQESARQVSDVMLSSVKNINSGGLAGFSLLLVLAGAMALITSIETAFNHIWGIKNLRPIKERFITYLALLVSGPITLFITLTLLSAKNLGFLDAIPIIGPFIQSTIAAILPLIIICVFLFILYYAVPNINVKISSAIVGSLVAGIFFSGNQLVAVFLVSKFNTFNTIYGSLAAVPIFLVSLFIAWMIILCGAQIAYAWQNVDVFRKEYLLEEVSPGDEEVIALKIMHQMASDFTRSGAAFDYEKASEKWELPSRLIRTILNKLEKVGLVYPVSGHSYQYLPGRELEKIFISDIVQSVRFGEKGFRPLKEMDEDQNINSLYKQAVLIDNLKSNKTLKEIVNQKDK